MTGNRATGRGAPMPDVLRVESGRCVRDVVGGILRRRWRASVRVFDGEGGSAAGEGVAGDPAVAFRRAVDAGIRALRGIEIGGAS